MSTKIYSAYKFDKPAHLVIPSLFSYRNRVLASARYALRSLIKIDAKFSDVFDPVKNAISSGLNDPLNFSSSIVVAVHPKISGTIIIPFGVEHIERVSKKKVRLPAGAKDWGYWNNSDKPDKVTDEEWIQRQKEYDMLIAQGGTSFSEMGLVMEIINLENASKFVFETLKEMREMKAAA